MDIVPVRKTWKRENSTHFGDLVRETKLEMFIHDIKEGLLYVSLYKQKHLDSGEPLCLNELLISEGAARGVGM